MGDIVAVVVALVVVVLSIATAWLLGSVGKHGSVLMVHACRIAIYGHTQWPHSVAWKRCRVLLAVMDESR